MTMSLLFHEFHQMHHNIYFLLPTDFFLEMYNRYFIMNCNDFFFVQGINGKKGQKGEAGTTFSTVLKDGSYIEVKVSTVSCSNPALILCVYTLNHFCEFHCNVI